MLENATNVAPAMWSAERSALLADALHRGAHLGQGLRLRVHGASMLPTLWPGDVVEVASCSLADLRPGEIVLARREGRLFLHRLIAPCTPNGFLLRGDSMPAADPLFPPDALLGRLVGSANKRQSASPPVLHQDSGEKGFDARKFDAKWARAAGMLFCHCSVARRLALKLHSRGQASARELRDPESTAEMGPL
jgi:hypothetical protein